MCNLLISKIKHGPFNLILKSTEKAVIIDKLIAGLEYKFSVSIVQYHAVIQFCDIGKGKNIYRVWKIPDNRCKYSKR